MTAPASPTAPQTSSTTLTVGAGMEFSTIASAVSAASSGDTILVQAGTYTNDFATFSKSLTLEGVGGLVNVVATEPPPGLKAIFDEGGPGVSVTIDDFAFSGAAIPSTDGGNAAAIRYEGGDLSLTSDVFSGNQDGLLANADPDGTITIDDGYFSDNGVSNPNSSGYGLTHNLYVNGVATLTIDNSLFTDANIGHEIKSRALNTVIENSRIQDGPDGTASYDIDLPNGGNAVIENNTIEKGPGAMNPVMISYGEEGGTLPNSNLTVSGNTILDDDGSSVIGVGNATGVTATIADNSIYGLGAGNVAFGPADISGTTMLASEPALDTAPPPILCFCRGTLIRVPSGEVAVERLAVGDAVVTLSEDAKPIRWIGRARIPVPANGTGEAAVIIAAGALAEGVPHRDLHLTRGHALYLDGVLIPAENLVNHRSIAWDRRSQQLEVVHIEFDSHEVLLANGAPAESYRDDGNGVWFEAPHPGATLPPFAPIVTGGKRLEQIWRRLLDRAGDPAPAAWIDDPDLHLLADGARIAASEVKDRVHVFRLDRLPRTLCIASRSTIPAAAGLNTDQRRLGVAVRKIVLRGDGLRTSIGYDAAVLRDGFHGPESRDRWRWTDGRATLPAALWAAFGGEMTVTIEVGCTLRYVVETQAPATQVAA